MKQEWCFWNTDFPNSWAVCCLTRVIEKRRSASAGAARERGLFSSRRLDKRPQWVLSKGTLGPAWPKSWRPSSVPVTFMTSDWPAHFSGSGSLTCCFLADWTVDLLAQRLFSRSSNDPSIFLGTWSYHWQEQKSWSSYFAGKRAEVQTESNISC